jgi:hypothetical protein
MELELEKVGYDEMKKIYVDTETLRIFEELLGINKCCYDWWELSQGMKNIAVGLKLLKRL